MISGYYLTQAIYAAAKLNIADELVKGPRDARSLAAAVGADAGSLYRLLRALASMGIFALGRDERFRMTSLGHALRSDAALSLRPWAIYNGEPFHWRSWGKLLPAVRTGSSGVELCFDTTFFDLLEADAAASAAFDAAMSSLADALNPVLSRSYDFGQIRTLADIGGGNGNFLAAILRRYPRLHGVVFDAPHVARNARSFIERQRLANRCMVLGGDFFTAVPAGFDGYLLKQVLHDWTDARALVILKHIRAAVASPGILLLVEMVVPPGNAPAMAKLVDLEMLACTGGRERTAAEFGQLLGAAGFALKQIRPTTSPLCILEAVPDSDAASGR